MRSVFRFTEFSCLLFVLAFHQKACVVFKHKTARYEEVWSARNLRRSLALLYLVRLKPILGEFYVSGIWLTLMSKYSKVLNPNFVGLKPLTPVLPPVSSPKCVHPLELAISITPIETI
jgi:hypothetical protein